MSDAMTQGGRCYDTGLYKLQCESTIGYAKTEGSKNLKGVMTRSMVEAFSELCSPFLKGGNSAFITAIASGLVPQTEYRSLE